jgi:hypothetical protein
MKPPLYTKPYLLIALCLSLVSVAYYQLRPARQALIVRLNASAEVSNSLMLAYTLSNTSSKPVDITFGIIQLHQSSRSPHFGVGVETLVIAASEASIHPGQLFTWEVGTVRPHDKCRLQYEERMQDFPSGAYNWIATCMSLHCPLLSDFVPPAWARHRRSTPWERLPSIRPTIASSEQEAAQDSVPTP